MRGRRRPGGGGRRGPFPAARGAGTPSAAPRPPARSKGTQNLKFDNSTVPKDRGLTETEAGSMIASTPSPTNLKPGGEGGGGGGGGGGEERSRRTSRREPPPERRRAGSPRNCRAFVAHLSRTCRALVAHLLVQGVAEAPGKAARGVPGHGPPGACPKPRPRSLAGAPRRPLLEQFSSAVPSGRSSSLPISV